MELVGWFMFEALEMGSTVFLGRLGWSASSRPRFVSRKASWNFRSSKMLWVARVCIYVFVFVYFCFCSGRLLLVCY